MINREFR